VTLGGGLVALVAATQPRPSPPGFALGRSSSWYHCSSMPRSGFPRQDGTKRRAAQPFVITAAAPSDRNSGRPRRCGGNNPARRRPVPAAPRIPEHRVDVRAPCTRRCVPSDQAQAFHYGAGGSQKETRRLVIARHQRIAANIGSVIRAVRPTTDDFACPSANGSSPQSLPPDPTASRCSLAASIKEQRSKAPRQVQERHTPRWPW
jgi:hypothetical protein